MSVSVAELNFKDIYTKRGYTVTKKGWPDFICTKANEIMTVEVKPNKKQHPTNEQKFIIQFLCSLGIPTYVYYAAENVFVDVHGNEVEPRTAVLSHNWQRDRYSSTANKSERAFIQIMESRGFSVSKKGWPDFFLKKGNHHLCVEVKLTREHTLSLAQFFVMRVLQSFGAALYRCDDDVQECSPMEKIRKRSTKQNDRAEMFAEMRREVRRTRYVSIFEEMAAEKLGKKITPPEQSVMDIPRKPEKGKRERKLAMFYARQGRA